MDNYLSAEQQIIDRLTEKVPVLHVSDWADYASIEEARMPNTPAAYVLYQGDVPTEAGGKGAVQRVDQQWGVVVVVRNVSGRSGKGIREEAGPLMAKIMAALMGWSPEGYRPLQRQPAPPPSYSNLVGYFPLLFSAGLIITGDNA